MGILHEKYPTLVTRMPERIDISLLSLHLRQRRAAEIWSGYLFFHSGRAHGCVLSAQLPPLCCQPTAPKCFCRCAKAAFLSSWSSGIRLFYDISRFLFQTQRIFSKRSCRGSLRSKFHCRIVDATVFFWL